MLSLRVTFCSTMRSVARRSWTQEMCQHRCNPFGSRAGHPIPTPIRGAPLNHDVLGRILELNATLGVKPDALYLNQIP